MADTLADRYSEIRAAVDREFRRNRKLHGRRIHCRLGCTDCCHHIFHITEIEAARISRAVKALPPAERGLLEQRPRAYLPAQREILREHGFLQAWGSLPRPGTRLACPALNGGACVIYKERPLICRKYGMPLYYPEKQDRTFACELNFETGEGIHDPELVRIQPAIREQERRLEEDYNRAGGRRYPLPVTVAHAILEDFEEFLP